MQEQWEIWNLIIEYYKKRGLKWPDFDDAMKFVLTEIGEVYEIDLSRVGGWVRNNPQDKPEFDKEALGRELGDVIMMLMVAGIAEGVNPLAALVNKINKKLEAINTYKQLPLKEVEHE
jgi:NTP pyrophosphatase (non-canonical NTP hydrolase)